MTTKEIAEATGKDVSTVQKWIKRMNGKMPSMDGKMQSSTSTKPADFNLEETINIIEYGMGKNAAALYRMNAKDEPLQNDKVSDLDTAFKLAIIALTKNTENLDKRMSRIEEKIEQRQALLPAPQLDPRAHIVKLVTNHVGKTGQEFRDVYQSLYREYGYRTHCNPSVCAKNRNMKIIDFIDSEGQIEILESIAMEIFQ